ncbi:adenosylmethionine--8-amino-7-oxononanoate transaminase [Haliangium sp.]|uniref:adenosylmethionine--8-amino-7-oxononanoate transaminase n=1 Tax=Haliangium sp. TaxID=2663208 RepID=UPI003D10E945
MKNAPATRLGQDRADPARTRHLVELDQRHVWHPFTQMRQWNEGEPLVIERAEGNYLIDSDGRRYLDGVASLWTNVHGHRRTEINDAITEQLGKVAHSTLLGLCNVPAVELAARLVELSPPGLSKVFYSDNGSTAVEIALKQAFQYWQHRGREHKRMFVHLEDSYHGDTLGAVGVGGIELFHQVYGPLLVDSLAVPTPHLYRHPSASTPEEARDQALAALEALLTERAGDIAAMIIEPLVQGAAGMLIQPEGYLRGVAELCREHEVLLIADEVATGFGRTGTLFACEQEGVVPDFLCLAKGITGGYLPLAATLATDEVYETFLGAASEYKTFFHGHTYTGNPLACAAALASLDLFEKDAVLASLPDKIQTLSTLLRERLGPSSSVGDIRQRGLMVGVELVADRDTAGPFPPEQLTGARVCHAARAHGVIVRNLGDVVVLMPPLSVTASELELLVDAVARGIAAVCP